MSYLDKNLVAGEQVVFRTRLHWIIYLKSIFVFILVLVISSSGVIYQNNWLYGIAAIFLFIAIILFIASWIKYISSEFGVTNSRVLIKVGFISRNSLELLISKVEGIGVNQSIFGRIFNYGTIIVTGTGGTKESFSIISQPLEFRKKVQEQIIALQGIKTQG